MGQDFWHLISGKENLYSDIVIPLAFRAKEHNESFDQQKGRIINLFTKQFIDRFCEPDGAINWIKLVEFNSRNFDLDRFLPE